MSLKAALIRGHREPPFTFPGYDPRAEDTDVASQSLTRSMVRC